MKRQPQQAYIHAQPIDRPTRVCLAATPSQSVLRADGIGLFQVTIEGLEESPRVGLGPSLHFRRICIAASGPQWKSERCGTTTLLVNVRAKQMRPTLSYCKIDNSVQVKQEEALNM